jgi:hypothetical protein
MHFVAMLASFRSWLRSWQPAAVSTSSVAGPSAASPHAQRHLHGTWHCGYSLHRHGGDARVSIANEVNPPLAAIVTDGKVCLQWLGREVPDLAEVREPLDNIVNNGRRASEILFARFPGRSRPRTSRWTSTTKVVVFQ